MKVSHSSKILKYKWIIIFFFYIAWKHYEYFVTITKANSFLNYKSFTLKYHGKKLRKLISKLQMFHIKISWCSIKKGEMIKIWKK